MLSYRFFKVSPDGYGGAFGLCSDFSFLPKVAPDKSTSSPAWHRPPDRDRVLVWEGESGVFFRAECRLGPSRQRSPDPCDSNVNKAAFPERRGGPSVKTDKYREI